MTAYQFLATLFYGAFAAFAFLGTWGKEGKAQVGGMLLACWVASNVLFWISPITFRPAVLPVLDVFFALTAAKAGKETRSRVPVVLIALSVLAVVTNTAFSISGAGSSGQVYIYEITLNIIFALQCVITGGWGVADAIGRLVRLDPGAGDMRRHPELRRSPED